ncbi:MAG: PHP domain-containing protein, partial [Rhodocyclaceae bacterium]|nr:PHP domain-containing protein [Rhodocyclaceae bacterium]
MPPAAGCGVDLHCHSSASDGVLAPAQVVMRAANNGVRLLALTDHDTLDGLDEAFACARQHRGLRLLAGVEISASFHDASVHIVGLDVDADNAALRAGLQRVRDGRAKR